MYRIQLVEKCSFAEKKKCVDPSCGFRETVSDMLAGPVGRAQTVRGAGKVDAMPVRGVVPLHQMRIIGFVPAPPGHTRDIMALCGARNVHTRPV